MDHNIQGNHIPASQCVSCMLAVLPIGGAGELGL